MKKNSLIYNNLFVYRVLMNLLYKGGYRKRYQPVCKLISGHKVTELCFGDTIIAEHCKKNNIDWIGIDINDGFVRRAKKKGLNAEVKNIQSLEEFPKADTCIISGSLYHFNEDIENLFLKMLNCAPVIIISEPVINLSNRKGIIGKLARASATVKGQQQQFRFTEQSLIDALNTLSKKLNFSYKITDRFEKDLIVVLNK